MPFDPSLLEKAKAELPAKSGFDPARLEAAKKKWKRLFPEAFRECLRRTQRSLKGSFKKPTWPLQMLGSSA